MDNNNNTNNDNNNINIKQFDLPQIRSTKWLLQ